jgi:hypothetical protein
VARGLTAVQRGNADGIGYMLLGSGIGAVDLDHVVEDAKLLRWAEQLCAEAEAAYQETTVSGAGLRIIGTTVGPETHRKFTFDRKTGAGIELYRNTARYITVSALETSHCAALPPLDHLIDKLLARHGYGQAQPLDFNTARPQHELERWSGTSPAKDARRSRSPTNWQSIPTVSVPNMPTGCSRR